MNEIIHDDNNSSQQNSIPNQSQEIVNVLEIYLDNPTIAIELVKDAKTPAEIIQQIALNNSNPKAQILAITRIVNSQDTIYSIDFFNQILSLCDIDDKNFWWFLPEIFIIILKWKNTPLETLEFIFQALRKNRPTRLWLSKSDQVSEILNMILHSWNQNITEWFMSIIQREIEHVKSLSDERKELKASKVQRVYTSSSGSSEKDPVGRSNYKSGNHHWHGKW